MAGTQQLPSWMTLSITTITNSEGIPVTTSTTTLQLPLTYYGPSIPLGTDGAWTWGGLYPPSSSPPIASPTVTPTSSIATPLPSTATPLPSSTATPSPVTPTFTTPTAVSTTASPSSTTQPSAASTLSKGALIGIIFGAIAAFVLLLLLLVCVIRWRARRRRNGYRSTPIWTHWEIIHPAGPRSTDGDRPAGVGSPRGSGDEVDSFLQRSQSGGQRHTSNIPPLPPGAAPPVIGSTTSGGSSHTSSSVVTDYGVLLPDSGRIGQAYSDSYFPAARASSEMTGHIIPPGELLRIDDDDEEPQSPPRMYDVSRGEDSDPLLPHLSPLSPPPPFDSEKYSTRKTPSVIEKEKSVRSLSYPASDMEASEVFTARRVLVRDVGPRSVESAETSAHSHSEASPVAGPSGWRGSFGLGSLQRLRQSWFGGSSHHTSRSSNGRPPRSRSRNGLSLVIGGDRPLSSVSTKSAVSGNTVYHDAVSRLGTPVSIPSRAMTPATGGGATLGQNVPSLPLGSPPAYALEDPYSSLGSRGSFPYSQGLDVLDLPVPTPASQFTASGGTNRGTPPRALRESLSVITGSSNEPSITIDVLDAEPPAAGEGWRTMAEGVRSIGHDPGLDTGERRSTFGTVSLCRSELLSEQGSLHSLGSYAGPHSHSSVSGSARNSGYSNVHSGSMSSRPSAQSAVHTASSGSLSHRLRRRTSGVPISPAVSAFGLARERSEHSTDNLPSPISRGSAYYSVPSSSDNGGFSRVSVLGPMPSFTARSVLAPTIQSTGATTTSDETEVTRTTVTAGASTTGTGGSGSGPETTTEDTGHLVDRFRSGDLDIGRWRV
ncbi:hypothetical protein EDC04DRAFT_2570841 [Pisolithus marmoratus]|nr:hypothetical protein EDC04DRAFT_2570841 [Pisolithus marmoratus]